MVSTLAGLAGSNVCMNGTGSAARLANPASVAVDTRGNVYVADSACTTIRRITPAGVVSTLGGIAVFSGSTDGPRGATQFAFPLGVAVDAVRNLYVADTENNTIRRAPSLWPSGSDRLRRRQQLDLTVFEASRGPA
jgi:sugar lactone lactonase YvrE